MLRLEFIVGLVVISCLVGYAIVLTLIGLFEDKKETKAKLLSLDDKTNR